MGGDVLAGPLLLVLSVDRWELNVEEPDVVEGPVGIEGPLISIGVVEPFVRYHFGVFGGCGSDIEDKEEAGISHGDPEVNLLAMTEVEKFQYSFIGVGRRKFDEVVSWEETQWWMVFRYGRDLGAVEKNVSWDCYC